MCQTMKLGAALAMATERLDRAGIEQPRREARRLAAHLLALPPSQVLDPDLPIDPAAYTALVGRRERREPMAFILGHRGFWTLDLAVSPDTLIPRPDSEILIEAAIGLFPDRARLHRILDLGTGTGCLLLAALAEFPEAFGVGVDLSPASALLATRNAAANGFLPRAVFLAGDWAGALAGKFDLILCNPPYIPSADVAGLMPEVARFEPRRALDGGADGLAAYARLMPEAARLLAPGGAAVFEIGQGQGDGVRALAEVAGLHHLAAEIDLAGIPRAVKLCRDEDAAEVESRGKKPAPKKSFGSTAVGS